MANNNGITKDQAYMVWLSCAILEHSELLNKENKEQIEAPS